MDEESYDDTDDFDEDESPKPRKTLMNMIRRRTQHQRPSYGSNFIYFHKIWKARDGIDVWYMAIIIIPPAHS